MKTTVLSMMLFSLSELCQANTAGQLLKSCQSEAIDADIQVFHQSGCVFFIRGVMDTHSTFVAIKRLQPIFCEPKNLTFNQVELTFTRWMEWNTDKQGWTAADAVLAALAEQYPCVPDADESVE